jgi:excisionase family DNA binding protein
MNVPLASECPTLSVREAAPFLGVSDSTLFRAIALDRSPVAFVKTGTRISIVTADLRRVLQLDPAPTNGDGQ